MKLEYYKKFEDLPQSRACQPEDAKDVWRQQSSYESASKTELEKFNKEGAQFLAFGPYNKLLRRRYTAPPAADAIGAIASTAPEQYIITSTGLFYIYGEGSLDETWLCFISTAATNKYPIGTLILAHPVEKDKALTALIYVPYGK